MKNYCPKCGFKIETSSNVCPKCNYKYDVKIKRYIRRGLILSFFGIISFIVWVVLMKVVPQPVGGANIWLGVMILIPILLCIFGAINLSSKV
ncbi:MAG: DUF2116 family Zn-ribbon domain-containing protein [Promethearchaeota archaeon]